MNVCKGESRSYDHKLYTWKVTGNSGRSMMGETAFRWTRHKEIKNAKLRLQQASEIWTILETTVRDMDRSSSTLDKEAVWTRLHHIEHQLFEMKKHTHTSQTKTKK